MYRTPSSLLLLNLLLLCSLARSQVQRIVHADTDSFFGLNNAVRLMDKELTDCRDAPISGIYNLTIPILQKTLQVRCEAQFKKGGWMVIQRRQDGSTDFYRPWADYKAGFGSLEREFWLGLDLLHLLTKSRRYELLVVIGNNNNRGFAKYDHFEIGPESDNYRLESIGVYGGQLGDSLIYHLGQQFSTFDRKNDGHDDENCALSYQGAWWYRQCYDSHLNGIYPLYTNIEDCEGRCAAWQSFFKDRPLHSIQMMIRSNHDDQWEN